MVIWGGLTNSWEKKRSERQSRKGKIYSSVCRVSKTEKRDKKAFPSDQCKEIEKNNRMRKIRNLFKKIRDTKWTLHARMGTIKDRNGTDLTEAEDIKKRWQKYTEELYKKDLHDLDNHDGMITHLEADILECEVKWALGSITTNKAMVFLVVMYRCESWTIKKAEHDAFELWCWRRLLRVPWTARRSNQSILKEISTEYSLEQLMLKLKLQYFGHLMQSTDSLENGTAEDEMVGWHH